MILSRRGILTGLASLIAAPAIVRAGSLMPVRGIIMPLTPIIIMPKPLNSVGIVSIKTVRPGWIEITERSQILSPYARHNPPLLAPVYLELSLCWSGS